MLWPTDCSCAGVGRVVEHMAVEGHRGRAAGVERHRGLRAQVGHEASELRVRHSGTRGSPAVDSDHDDPAVRKLSHRRPRVPREELAELAGKVETAKKLAPTRPHPGAPNSELFHKLVGPGVGMVDRLRDKLTHRATR